MSLASGLPARRSLFLSFPVLPLSVFFLCLSPGTSDSEEDFYFQVNTCALLRSFDSEQSDFWQNGPSIGAEVGCRIGRHLAPALSFSYTMLTLNWNEATLSGPIDEADRRFIEQRSYSASYLVLLKISDFEMDHPLRSYYSLGGGFQVTKAPRIYVNHWDDCNGGQTARRLSILRARTETDLLFGFGGGLEFGSRDKACVFVEGLLALAPDREGIVVPLEFGLRF
jgi:hypothetical protein